MQLKNYLMKVTTISLFTGSILLSVAAAADDFSLVPQQGGPTLGYSPTSGVEILQVDGLQFKDLNQNGKLDVYEDWRKPSQERAADLTKQLDIEDIAGLMLHAKSLNIKTPSPDEHAQTLIVEKRMRTFLSNRIQSPMMSAEWNNAAQAFVEALPFGMPINRSSDPRHSAGMNSEFDASGGDGISIWPRSMGMAATFDAERNREFGEIASAEYRAMGMATALSPQVDIATDPRWHRFYMTYGESPMLSADMGEAYISGFQSSPEDQRIEGGWGMQSVNAMVKHWPGGGSGESGRDAHVGSGKYAVYPGDNFQDHLTPFLEGAFKLKDLTGKASAIMPYYTISFDQDPSGENIANGYSKYLITDLLRNKYGYDELVCTDWNIHTQSASNFLHGGKAHGAEHLTEIERMYRIVMAGCDQFGGASDHESLMAAYQLGVNEHGEEWMRERFEESAVRILINSFRVGLFENPYLAIDAVTSTVGKPEFVAAGYQAQLDSVILLKNKNQVLPLDKKPKVYMPYTTFYPRNFKGQGAPVTRAAIDPEEASKYFEIVNSPEQAEVALVRVASPYNAQVYSGSTTTYKENNIDQGGYIPITLQYRPYVATLARERSLAYDADEKEKTRAYKGKTSVARNEAQLDVVLETKKAMGTKPVVVILEMYNPSVVAEFESVIDGLLMDFGSAESVLCQILSGAAEPSALLPFQMPANMETVETNLEDVPFDLECHVDTEGHTYDFAFGLNWSGVIQDERTQKYAIK
jgi:beta-glucosidase